MAIFGRDQARSEDEVVHGGDAATRALSSTAVENDFVEHVYEKLAKVYDLTESRAQLKGFRNYYDLLELIKKHPAEVADFLDSQGLDAQDICQYIADGYNF